MKVIEFRSVVVTLPETCACCMKPKEKALRITKRDLGRLGLSAVLDAAGAQGAALLQRTLHIDVPYCKECTKHIDWKRVGGYSGLLVGWFVSLIFAGFAAMILYVMADIAGLSWMERYPRAAPYLFAGLAAAAATANILWHARHRPRGPLAREHAREDLAVEVMAFTSKATTMRFYSDAFAGAAMIANPEARYVEPAPVASRGTRTGDRSSRGLPPRT